MTYDQLVAIQNWMSLVFLVFIAAGALYLIAGMISPSFVRAPGRGRVILKTLLIWTIGAGALAGTIAYTHSHENGPHSVKGYIEDYFKQQCAEGADLPACREGSGAPVTAPPAAR
ncbi:MAG: hypothetical protein ACKVP4_02090 [Hyphomicrobium sp.]